MRLVRGLAALLVLLLAVAGIPAALVLLGGNPLPSDISWAALKLALLRPDDGTIVIGLVTAIGWLAWLVFVVSLLLELVALLSGWRLQIAIPGSAGPQRLASGLLITVLAMAGSGHLAAASPTPTPPAAASPSSAGMSHSPPAPQSAPHHGSASSVVPVAAPSTPANRSADVSSTAPRERQLVHVVEHGDDLWSLAERYYGQGREWRTIAAANPQRLSGGPDRLQPGWRLVIPGGNSPAAVGDASGTVLVRPGDSLSAIAEELYGRSSQWVDIFSANRDQINDPDQIEPGTRLILPQGDDNKVDAARRAPKPEPEPETEQPRRSSHRDQAGSESKSQQDRPPGQVSPPQQTARPTAPPAPVDPSASPPESEESDPARSTGTTTDPVPEAEGLSDSGALDAVLGAGSVGGLLAAAVVGGLGLRRRAQLQARPVGRRILHPPQQAQTVETALGRVQQPVTLQTLDLAMRAITAHCRAAALPVPPLSVARVGRKMIELVMAEPAEEAPAGFTVAGKSWFLEHSDAHHLASIPDIAAATCPYPALVSLGHERRGDQLLVDLEAAGLLTLEVPDRADREAVLTALAAQLSFSPWADEVVVTFVGGGDGLAQALDKHNVSHTDDVDQLLQRLERRAALQRRHQDRGVPRQNRIDPDLADPWTPEILLIHDELTNDQQRRLETLMVSTPRVAMAAVVTAPLAAASWSLQFAAAADGGSARVGEQPLAVLRPLGLELVPHQLKAPARRALVDLVVATGSDETTAAPWWSDEEAPALGPPPGNVTYLGRRFGGWGSASRDTAESGPGELITVTQPGGVDGVGWHHPVLRILGPVELLGARGTTPSRAAKQCLEYCGWLLEHPGTTAQAMASALVVAEGTRRSNMSRLRAWLGADPEGQPYLPDAYTGRIVLHPSVSSDWQRLQILTSAGVNKTSTGGLRAALELVRGAPLADAAPGQWHWAEELRTDMISALRDIGVEVCRRALLDHDIDLARWAAARALVAAPGDELLLAARIRTEHQAGNGAETERLTLQLAGQARSLGVDLDSETVMLLQEVMEGRVRARLA